MFEHGVYFKDFDKFFVGFDSLAKKYANFANDYSKLITNYPPYNIVKVDENKYAIELAVAGFGKQDLEIELDNDTLVVKGNTKTDEEADSNFVSVYQGIANRAFKRQFQLADNIEIQNCELANGLLRIFLEAIIPEHKKPKKIDIKDSK